MLDGAGIFHRADVTDCQQCFRTGICRAPARSPWEDKRAKSPFDVRPVRATHLRSRHAVGLQRVDGSAEHVGPCAPVGDAEPARGKSFQSESRACRRRNAALPGREICLSWVLGPPGRRVSSAILSMPRRAAKGIDLHPGST